MYIYTRLKVTGKLCLTFLEHDLKNQSQRDQEDQTKNNFHILHHFWQIFAKHLEKVSCRIFDF